MLACAQLVFNLLRWIGEEGGQGAGGPRRGSAPVPRLRTVMQDLIDVPARLCTDRRLEPVFPDHGPALGAFHHLYTQLTGPVATPTTRTEAARALRARKRRVVPAPTPGV